VGRIGEYARVAVECGYRLISRTYAPKYVLYHRVVGMYTRLTFFVVASKRNSTVGIEPLSYSFCDWVANHIKERVRRLHPSDALQGKLSHRSDAGTDHD